MTHSYDGTDNAQNGQATCETRRSALLLLMAFAAYACRVAAHVFLRFRAAGT